MFASMSSSAFDELNVNEAIVVKLKRSCSVVSYLFGRPSFLLFYFFHLRRNAGVCSFTGFDFEIPKRNNSTQRPAGDSGAT